MLPLLLDLLNSLSLTVDLLTLRQSSGQAQQSSPLPSIWSVATTFTVDSPLGVITVEYSPYYTASVHRFGFNGSKIISQTGFLAWYENVQKIESKFATPQEFAGDRVDKFLQRYKERQDLQQKYEDKRSTGLNNLWVQASSFDVTVLGQVRRSAQVETIQVTFTPNYIKDTLHHFEFRGSGISTTGYYSWFEPTVCSCATPKDFATVKAKELVEREQKRQLSDSLDKPPLNLHTQDKSVRIDKAKKLRAQADSMQKQIDVKINPAIGQQRPTARRTRIAEGIREEGYKLKQIQAWLYAIATAIENSTLPPILEVVSKQTLTLFAKIIDTTQKQWGEVEDLLLREKVWQSSNYQDYRNVLTKGGITNYEDTKSAIAALQALNTIPAADPTEVTIRRLEQQLIGLPIPGYFPTPPEIANHLITLAEIEPSMSVLEPSAGKGNIADLVIPMTGVIPSVIEPQARLQEILCLKGHKLVGTDFLIHQEQYDRIVQNPPFGKEFGRLHDIDHVLHAYSLLKPGGRLVSLMAASFTFSQETKASTFRDWLQTVKARVESLPDSYSFKDSERSTGVKVYVVVIDKMPTLTKVATTTPATVTRCVDLPMLQSVSELQKSIEASQAEVKQLSLALRQDLTQMGYTSNNDWESPEPDWKLASRLQEQKNINLLTTEIHNLSEVRMRELAALLSTPQETMQSFQVRSRWIEWVRLGNIHEHRDVSWEHFLEYQRSPTLMLTVLEQLYTTLQTFVVQLGK